MGIIDRFIDLAARPVPLRTLLIRRLLQRFPIGSYRARLNAGAVARPWYGLCVYLAALEARALGYRAITVVELGVAGGRGLLCLCEHAAEVERAVGIKIHVCGLDTGSGLPSTEDARDLLYCWPPGSFEMDHAALKRRLEGHAELIIGDVATTVASWRGSAEAPLGAVMFDLDLYSSTQAALPLLTTDQALPRIWCYMDDICGYGENAYSDRIGVREAIRDFNRSEQRTHLRDHLSQAYIFKGVWPESWHEQIYIYHRLGHPDYSRCLSAEKSELPL
ncbi:MAG TPA: hypothetical protein VMV15_04925 [Candidatus Binataceae bacterium]|nr:hypothetical protein [Candidatus Binataceae bacterium]